MATEEVIFQATFSASEAVQQFDSFINQLQTKLAGVASKINIGAISGASSTQIKERVDQLLSQTETATSKLEDRINKFTTNIRRSGANGLFDQNVVTRQIDVIEAKYRSLYNTVQRVNDKYQENINVTNADILALKKLLREVDNFDTQFRQVYNTLSRNSEQIQKNAKVMSLEYVNSITLAGFALQRFGSFINQYVTQPLIGTGRAVVDTLARFDEFEQRLSVMAGKSKEQVAAIRAMVFEVAKLPNIRLDETVELFDKLIILNKELFTPDKLKTFGEGFSRAMIAVTAAERKGVLDFITDVISSNQWSPNAARTLQGAPMLSKAIRQVTGGGVRATDVAATGMDAQDVLLKTFDVLSKMPAATETLQNRLDNLSDTFLKLRLRIGEAFNKQINDILDFIEHRAIPALDHLIEVVEKMPDSLKNLLLIISAITIALAPLFTVVGSLGLLIGGLSRMLTFFGLADVSITSIIAGLGQIIPIINSIGAFIATISLPLTAIVIAVGAIVAALVSIYAANEKGLGQWLLDAVGRIVDALGTMVTASGGIFYELGRIFLILTRLPGIYHALIGLAVVINGILEGVALFLRVYAGALETVVGTLEVIADLLQGKVYLAWNRLWLLALKFQDSVSPFTNEKLKNQIEEQTKVVEGLESVQAKAATTTTILTLAEEKSARAKKIADEAQQKQINSIKTLVDLLEKERNQVEENILSQQRLNVARQGTAVQQSGERIQKQLSESIDSSDYTSKAGRTTALADVKRAALLRDSFAEQAKASRTQQAVLTEAERQHKTLSAAYEAGLKNQGSLNADAIAYFETTIGGLDSFLKFGGDINVVLDGIEQQLPKTIEVNRAIFTMKQAFLAVTKNQGDINDEITQAQNENASEMLEYQKKALKATQDREDAIASGAITAKIEKKDEEIDGQQELIKRLYTELEVTNKTGEVIKQIIIAQKDLATQQLELLYLQKQQEYEKAPTDLDKTQVDNKFDPLIKRKQHLILKLSTGTADDKTAAELYRNRNKGAQEIDDMIKSLRSYEKNLDELGDVYIDLAKKGIASSGFQEYLEGIQKSAVFQNDIISKTRENVKQAYEGFEEISGISSVKDNDKALQVQKNLKLIVESFKIDEADLSNPQTLAKFLSQGQEILKFFTDPLIQKGDFFGGDAAAAGQLSTLIKRYLEFLKSVDDTKTKTDANIIKGQEQQIKYEEALGNFKLQNLSIDRDSLELQQKIIAEKQSGAMGYDIGNIKDFGKAIYDILTGGQQKTAQLQRQILENQKSAVEIEVRLALFRLETEQEIALIRLQSRIDEAGISDKEKAKRQAEYDDAVKLFAERKNQLQKQADLQTELINAQLDNVRTYSGNAAQIIVGAITDALSGVFSKKKKESSAALTKADAKETKESAETQVSWLQKLTGASGKTRDMIFSLGDAIAQMSDLSVKSILRAIKEELKALAIKMAVKALEYTALAIALTVMGDYSGAAKAAAAAYAYGTTAALAGGAAAIIGMVDGNGEAASQSASNASAGATSSSGEYNQDKDVELQRQKAMAVNIYLEARTDEGVLIKKYEAWVNYGNRFSNIIVNARDGFPTPVTP